MSKYKVWDYREKLKQESKNPDFERLQSESADEMWQESISFWINVYRKRRKVTQKMIAEELLISQPAVCQMLKKPATIGTLWRLCHAMGGQLEVNIRFGDEVKSLLIGDDPIHPSDAWMLEDK